ncbi:putative 2-oxoglutarate-dependent dioxygenase [Armadillidium nasatum]|uniref:Putative 2-oxoglutarate-dependent dioxygenase n=1 Tax=Armadillidium nasatum TaxID=96803 RepID=A0A5N5SKF5_9CRUS|nr:putative 2-oxoglutarate-dependent dioxygenase [Armadillidium nasatum]
MFTHSSKNVFQVKLKKFKQFLQQMYGILSDLLKKLLRCLEIGLDLPFGTLLDQHTNINSESSVTALRLIHYPPILFEVPENCIRCGEHTDYGTVTLLFQDNIGGLEVKNRNNEWVQAHPVPGAILVNVGDMLQTLTSGRLVATPHRVLIPEEERLKRCSRKSVAFFVNPNKKVVLKPFGAPEDDKKSYKTSHEHLHSRLSSALILKP